MRYISRLCLMGLAGLALAGCGGGGGNGSTPSGGDPLTNGRNALNRVASGAAPADTQTLQSILNQLQQALQQNPISPDAHFGIALCLAGEVGNALDGTGAIAGSGSAGSGSTGNGGGATGPPVLPPNTTLPAPPTTGEVPPAPPDHGLPIHPLPPVHQLSLLWNLDSSLGNPYALLNMLAPIGSLQYGLIPFYGYSQDNNDVARREQLLSKLDTVTQNLQAVEANPDFTTTLPDPFHQGQTVTVGLPEVYLFDAYVNSLRAELALSLAYVRDPGGVQLVPTPVPFNGAKSGGVPPAIFAVSSSSSGVSTGGNTGPSTIFLALDSNHDGKLSPSEYLPPSPYLTLRDASLLTKAQQAMLAITDRETKGIAGILARPANGAFLVPNTTEVQQVLTEVRNHVLPILQKAATGPITIELPRYNPNNPAAESADPPPPPPGSNQGGPFSLFPPPVPGGSEPPAPPIVTTETVTINIAAWFVHPPADLKSFAPTYTLNAQGFLDTSLTVYPDPTFGGLYPNRLPKDLLF